MTTLADKSLLSGGDNKPPMLEKHLYDSWKSRMELYMMNRPHGRMILASVEKETIQADCDIKAIKIILQGLPTEIYTLVSQHRVAKDIWEKIKLLMQGTSLTKQERECKLYDEFDKFTYKKGESLHEYYLRFTLLLNDMNIYNMPLEQFQVNTKFLNTLPAEWSKFVTGVKLVKDLHTTNVDQIHAHLKQHERHANEVRLMHERNSDPLALVASHQMTHDYPIDASNHVMSFLSAVVTSRYPTINNQLRNSSNPRQQATINDGRVTVQPVQGRQISYAMCTTRTFTPGASGSKLGKQRIVTCYNCKGEGHMSKKYTKPRRKRDDSGFKDKVLLVQAQASEQILHEEELAFLADPGILDCRENYGSRTDDVRFVKACGSVVRAERCVEMCYCNKSVNSLSDCESWQTREALGNGVTACAPVVSFAGHINLIESLDASSILCFTSLTLTLRHFEKGVRYQSSGSLETSEGLPCQSPTNKSFQTPHFPPRLELFANRLNHSCCSFPVTLSPYCLWYIFHPNPFQTILKSSLNIIGVPSLKCVFINTHRFVLLVFVLIDETSGIGVCCIGIPSFKIRSVRIWLCDVELLSSSQHLIEGLQPAFGLQYFL
ncbi:hypothetical protein Tco_0663606 [Tanacetum coccineum]